MEGDWGGANCASGAAVGCLKGGQDLKPFRNPSLYIGAETSASVSNAVLDSLIPNYAKTLPMGAMVGDEHNFILNYFGSKSEATSF